MDNFIDELRDDFDDGEVKVLDKDTEDKSLLSVSDLVESQVAVEKVIEDLESKLKEANKKLVLIQQKLLPEALFAVGLNSIKTQNGDTVEVKEDLSISVPKDKMAEITEWLNKNGHGEVVTGRVLIELPKNSDNERKAAITALTDIGLEPIVDVTVNSSTLKSILKKHLGAGENIDLKDFGAYAWKKAVIKRK